MQKSDTAAKPEQGERKERGDTVDFKMVTFALSGKDYGVDIMNVKEIAKAGKFTFVPNAAPYLRGVYNLRGDIIPIVDLRVFFHLPAERKSEDALENMLILRLGEHVFGIIVDNIDKVVGISSSSIQPPHPIFGDINIKYIRGVVENQDRLYIILDVLRIFAQKEEEKPRVVAEASSSAFVAPALSSVRPDEDNRRGPASGSELEFIKETLSALKRFETSEVNEEWVGERFQEWKKLRKGQDLQLRSPEDAEEYLSPFPSPCTGAFWSDDYAQSVLDILPDTASRNLQVWNPGCGKGQETFSFACILRKRYPDRNIKIWANDSDLLAISSAPNLIFDLEDVPEFYREFMVKAKNGYIFNQTIKDSILFEYHDVLNMNPYPELDIILSRDLLSFLPVMEQKRVLTDFSEKLKGRGLVIVGKNERIRWEDWKSVGTDPVSAYMRSE